MTKQESTPPISAQERFQEYQRYYEGELALQKSCYLDMLFVYMQQHPQPEHMEIESLHGLSRFVLLM